jgi:hypothetical protein
MTEPTQLDPTQPDPAQPAPAPTQIDSTQPVPTANDPFSVLRVMATAWRITKHNFVPFLVLAIVLELPGTLLQLGGGTSSVLLSIFASTITGALMQAVVVYGVVMELQGTRPSTGACVRAGFAHLGRVVGVTVVSTFAVAGAMLLLAVPGIIVFLMFYVAVPVTVVEGLGIRAALKRSRELTHGRKGALFLLFIAAALIAIPNYFIARELGAEAAFVWRLLSSAFTGTFFAVTVGVAYVELRKLRDGIHIPDLATAFARFRK